MTISQQGLEVTNAPGTGDSGVGGTVSRLLMLWFHHRGTTGQTKSGSIDYTDQRASSDGERAPETQIALLARSIPPSPSPPILAMDDATPKESKPGSKANESAWTDSLSVHRTPRGGSFCALETVFQIRSSGGGPGSRATFRRRSCWVGRGVRESLMARKDRRSFVSDSPHRRVSLPTSAPRFVRGPNRGVSLQN